jgi:hypothetical protein
MTREEEKTISADVIEARCIRLVDESGKVSIELSTSQIGDGVRLTVIQILDDNGQPRLELQVSNDEAGIRIVDKSDKASISLATRKYGSGLSVQNAEGSLSIVAGVANEIRPGIDNHRV